MNELLTIAEQNLVLHRHPRHKKETLQAWDSADEYLINHFTENELQKQLGEDGQLLIINDGFGALSCFFQDYKRTTVTDSYISLSSIKLNMQRNNCATENILLQDCLQTFPENVKIVLIKVPKTNAYLEYLLQQLRTVVAPDTIIVAAGKVNMIHNSTLDLFEKYIGSTKTSLAKKKSRLIFSLVERQNVPEDEIATTWEVEKQQWKIHNHANVFSRNHLDIGGRYLMDNLPDGEFEKIVDLGCGNGVVGMSAMETYSDAQVTFIDESYMAVDSARINVIKNFEEEQSDTARFVVNNGLVGFKPRSYDLILCNPPFHQQQVITDHIAWSMFNDAHFCLQDNGELVIVGNRHLDYQDKLERIFGNCELVTENKKFVILRAVKMD
ncbi:23S rRNA (guanine(1835)-N(2))-methyltransferase [Psychromonas sp. psych-6C06]|uniref:methyltransferase n=1 Tax=Psychromonas sp. psych-6C06 TaxID=2058089 RepID=UPI000C331FF2|nr:methyltransferase [Psychromonas sp. psych-6C06]PKF63621.1 23S rRNA (guanine(1835)-N(2))-methyltransferase [Psychromonas sp. psych-6C06]